MPSGIGGRAVNFRRVLPAERPTSVPAFTSEGIDDDLAAGQARVSGRPANDKASGRVDVQNEVVVDEVRRNDARKKLIADVRLDGLQRNIRMMLRGNDDGVDAPRRFPVVLILYRNLSLRIGPQICEFSFVAHRS